MTEGGEQEQVELGKTRINRFIQTFKSDDKEVRSYKGRKRYKKRSIRLLIGTFALWFGIIAVGVHFPLADNVLQWSSIIIGMSTLIFFSFYMLADVKLSRSGLDNEDVAFHELASAFNTNHDQGSIPIVVRHLSEAREYLSDADTYYISDVERANVLEYLSAIENAANQEDAVRITLPKFENRLAHAVSIPKQSRMEDLLDHIEQPPMEDINSSQRALSDLMSSLRWVLTGFTGILILALSSGFIVYQYFGNSAAGAAAFVGVFTAYEAYRQRGE